MVKFPEADKRLFRNKFVCRKCKSVVRAPSRKVARNKLGAEIAIVECLKQSVRSKQ